MSFAELAQKLSMTMRWKGFAVMPWAETGLSGIAGGSSAYVAPPVSPDTWIPNPMTFGNNVV